MPKEKKNKKKKNKKKTAVRKKKIFFVFFFMKLKNISIDTNLCRATLKKLPGTLL
jgi:hypothetical protein